MHQGSEDAGNGRGHRPEAAVHGYCDPRFQGVKERFEVNFAEHGELGASVAIYVEDRLVVDLWGGFRDWERTKPWTRNTIVCGTSLSKALTAECVHILVDRGLLHWDEQVARYWPAFAANGKEEVTIRQLLSHQAGLPAIRRPLPAGAEEDWALITGALAAEEPWWTPGTTHGYHVATYGHLVAELVRRVTGQSFVHFFRETISGPLDVDIHFGVGPEEDERIADFIIANPIPRPASDGTPARELLLQRVYDNPATLVGFPLNEVRYADISANQRSWRANVLPGVNAHLNARAFAKLCTTHTLGGQSMDGKRIMSREVLDESLTAQVTGMDAVLALPSCFALGFRRWQEELKVGPNHERSHFAPGLGGTLAVVDPDARIAFAYLLNEPWPRYSGLNQRNVPLIDEAYASL